MQPDFERTAAAMVTGAQKAIAAAVAPLVARAEAAEARAMELETRLAAVEAREPIPGPQGDPGERGADGFGLSGGMIDRSGVLILTLSNGETKELGVVVGKDGADGRDGVDGANGSDGIDGKDGIDGANGNDGKDGIDGKSVDLDEVMSAAAPLIAEKVADAVAAIPAPKDGERGAGGIDGRDGIDGKDADPSAVAKALEPFIVGEIGAEIAKLPRPENGTDGKSVTLDDVAPLIEGAVTKAVAALPPAEKGDPGEVDMVEVAAKIETAVKSAVAALPVPRDGEPGKDGVSVAKALIDAEGGLVLTLTDGSVQELGRVKGEAGETFTLDDFEIVPYDDGRTFKFCFTRGDFMHSFEFSFPVPLDKGVYREGQAYERGDIVTYGGSLWSAQKDTSDKPEASDAWRLAVKRGRDGKPGKDAFNQEPLA